MNFYLPFTFLLSHFSFISASSSNKERKIELELKLPLSLSEKIDSKGGASTFLASESFSHPLEKNQIIQETKASHLNTMVKDSEVNAMDTLTPREEVHSPTNIKPDGSKGHIETKAPIESVKSAISKFGGVDWKANRVHAVEIDKSVEEELEELEEEALKCRKRSEAAAQSELQVLEQLENTKHCIEELKLELERAQMEEHQAKQDAELAKLRLKETEQEITGKNDTTGETEIVAAMAEHDAAVLELKSIKEELETLHKKFDSVANERALAVKSAVDAVAAAKEAEKAIEQLNVELVVIKKSLDSAQAALIETEEQRISAAMAKEQDCSNWKKELAESEEEISKLSLQILSVEDLKSNVNTASTLLFNLKAEMRTYMESILKEDKSAEHYMNGEIAGTEMETHTTKQSVVDSKKGELEAVKLNIEKAVAEVKCLKMAATSLKSELEEEKSTVATMKQREDMLSVLAASLEAELERNTKEIVVAEGTMKEAQNNAEKLADQFEKAAQEADHTKSLAQMASEDLQKAKIEAEQTKAEAKAMESRLLAAQKEIEAANASKMLALAAIKALQESDSAGNAEANSPIGVTLPLEEYHKLSKCACEAEEQANLRVTEARSQVEAMKESEAKSHKMLEEVSQELVTRMDELKSAIKKREEAEEGNSAAEQELSTRRADQEQQLKDAESSQEEPVSSTSKVQIQISDSKVDSLPDSKEGKRKKKSFFPKMLTLLSKHKASRKKST